MVGGREEYKGRFKQSSIDAAKSAAVNRILDQKQENQMINDLIRGKIIGGIRTRLEASSPSLERELRALYAHLPKDRRLWKYNTNVMKPLRPVLDYISKEFIAQYHKKDFQELVKLLKLQEDKYSLAYGKGKSSNQFTKNRLQDLYARMGNSILRELKEMDKAVKKAGLTEFSEPSPESEILLKAPDIDPLFSILEKPLDSEIPLEPEDYGEPHPAFAGEFILEWSKEYKLARRFLYGTKKRKPDFQKAFNALFQEAEKGNVLAMDDLGKMFAYGMGREIDQSAAGEWYSLALQGIPGVIFSGFLSISGLPGSASTTIMALGQKKTMPKPLNIFSQPPTQEINTLNTLWLDYTCTVRVSRKILRPLMFITMLPQKKETPMRCTSLRKWSVTALGQI